MPVERMPLRTISADGGVGFQKCYADAAGGLSREAGHGDGGDGGIIGALLVLAAAVNIHATGAFQPGAMAWLVVKLGIYCGAVLYAYPRLTRWFFKNYGEKVTQYVFILALVFLSLDPDCPLWRPTNESRTNSVQTIRCAEYPCCQTTR